MTLTAKTKSINTLSGEVKLLKSEIAKLDAEWKSLKAAEAAAKTKAEAKPASAKKASAAAGPPDFDQLLKDWKAEGKRAGFEGGDLATYVAQCKMAAMKDK